MAIFKKIYIIGTGAMPVHCAELFLARGQQCSFLDTSSLYSPFISRRLEELSIPFFNVSRNNLLDFFQDSTPTLVISASNLLIFPEELIELPNVIIFNYHNSLLPLHKGVNAEAWTIYEGDPTAGVTWHKVEKEIDSGAILAQNEFSLPPDITSANLLKMQADRALAMLESSLDNILAGTFSLKEQPNLTGSLHKKSDRPNNGVISPDLDSTKIWHFLRAYDYGIAKNLGVPVININGTFHAWGKYQKASSLLLHHCSFPDTFRIGDIILQDLHPVATSSAIIS